MKPMKMTGTLNVRLLMKAVALFAFYPRDVLPWVLIFLPVYLAFLFRKYIFWQMGLFKCFSTNFYCCKTVMKAFCYQKETIQLICSKSSWLGSIWMQEAFIAFYEVLESSIRRFWPPKNNSPKCKTPNLVSYSSF